MFDKLLNIKQVTHEKLYPFPYHPFFPSFLLSQNYLNETSKWYTVHSDGFDNWWEFSNLEIDGDTTINGLNYFKIKKKYTYVYIGPFWDQFDVTEGVHQLYLREENKKIYRHHNNADQFIIDFDLTIGDSLNSYFGKEYITEIDSFEFNGEMRKYSEPIGKKRFMKESGQALAYLTGSISEEMKSTAPSRAIRKMKKPYRSTTSRLNQ